MAEVQYEIAEHLVTSLQDIDGSPYTHTVPDANVRLGELELVVSESGDDILVDIDHMNVIEENAQTARVWYHYVVRWYPKYTSENLNINTDHVDCVSDIIRALKSGNDNNGIYKPRRGNLAMTTEITSAGHDIDIDNMKPFTWVDLRCLSIVNPETFTALS